MERYHMVRTGFCVMSAEHDFTPDLRTQSEAIIAFLRQTTIFDPLSIVRCAGRSDRRVPDSSAEDSETTQFLACNRPVTSRHAEMGT
jgi:hypothetical protein